MAERQIYTIPSDIPFLESLAQGLLLRTQYDFARTLVLLPTRRACRSLRDTFLSLNDGKPILLPRMQPLGDVDQDELDLHLAGLYGVKDLPDIAPAMPSLKRLMLLSRLVSTYDPSLSHEQSLKLSSALATLIDQAHTENLDFSRLVDLAPAGDLADHWQLTLKFLEIITEHWPAILEREGELDPADRRNRLMKALGSAWREKPPPFPLIAAGSTGSIPATSDLLDVISASPQGVVILPGLDQDLDQLSWDNFGATHPQATMRSLLSRLETDRKKVKIWPTVVQRSSPRLLLAREIMRPADTINSWNCLTEDQEIIASLKASLENLELIETKTLSDEASTIAIIMREALEIEGRTAALITPDRELARRVSSALKKWNIIVDDSAGSTLPALASGLFLEFILTCVCDNFSLISLLNLLKNPLCKTFADTELLRKFELLLCRGPRPQLGLETLRTRTQALIPPDPEILNLVEFLEAAFSPLYPLQNGQHSIKNYAISLATVAEFLSGNHNKPWQGEDGEAASLLLISLQDQAHAISDLGLRAFRDTLNYLMQTVIVHPAKETHPRLVILGQLEARMIQKDVMILGGLNEGSWPAEIPHDPWMSRLMRI